MILQNWWYTTLLGSTTPIQQPLRSHIKADILVIGAGMAGLSAALALMDKGRRVVVLERNICGGSSTGKSAGFLTPDSELELSQLLRRFGPEGARDLWEVAVRGGDIITSTVRRFGIECDLVGQDCLYLAKGRRGLRAVKEEAKARESLGYPAILYNEAQLPSVIGSRGYSGAVRYSGTYGIDALRYSQGLKRVLLDHGIEIYEASEVTHVEDHTAYTHLGSVTADQMIFCSDKMSPQLTQYSWNVYHAQTFLSISEPLPDTDVLEMFPDGPLQCWDSDLIYTYFRLTGSGRLLVGGGSLWTTYAKNDVTTSDVIDRVIHGLRAKFQCLKRVEFIQYWPGRIDMTRDLLPTVLRDQESPWIHFVLGCVGLPWAAFCGDFVARHVLDSSGHEDDQFYRYFDVNRGFLLPVRAEKLLGKRLVFTLNNAWAKYYETQKPTL